MKSGGLDYEILVRFLLAALWGGLVGAEREYRSKSAGFRTMIMISLGSCFFTMMSVWIGGPGNPDRMAANIITGIGFLGAGVIFRGESRVNGINTAAAIWVVSAVGMGIGAGYYFAAAAACLLVFIVLGVLLYCEKIIDRISQSKRYTIKCTYSDNVVPHFHQLLKQNNLRHRLTNQIKEGDCLSTTWQVRGHAKDHDQFIAAMTKDEAILRFEY